MRAWWVGVIASVLGAVATPQEADAFFRRGCQQQNCATTVGTCAPGWTGGIAQEAEDMVTITEKRTVTVYQMVPREEKYTYYDPMSRTWKEATRTVQVPVAMTQEQTFQRNVPANSPEGLRFRLGQVKSELDDLKKSVGPRPNEKPIQKQIDEIRPPKPATGGTSGAGTDK